MVDLGQKKVNTCLPFFMPKIEIGVVSGESLILAQNFNDPFLPFSPNTR